MLLNTSLRAAALALTFTVMACAKGADQGGEGGTSNVGSGGMGGAGGAGGSATSTGGGLPTSCTKGEECAPLSDACNQGACVNGMCAKLPDKAKENGPCEDGLYC